MALFRSMFFKTALALAAAAALPARAAEANFLTVLAAGRHQTLVTYGTSLTANSAWPALLEETLRDAFGRRSVRVLNKAGGGKDSRWGLANLQERVIAKKPDTIFLEFAINDAVAASHLSVSESMGNLEQMIATIRRELPDCDIILMIMNPPAGDALRQRPEIRKYEAGWRRVAAEQHCWLVDFSWKWRKIASREPARWAALAPDGLHPKPRACREVILPYLLEKLGYDPQRKVGGG
jgi:lysophospholipase L1-like esterase